MSYVLCAEMGAIAGGAMSEWLGMPSCPGGQDPVIWVVGSAFKSMGYVSIGFL